MSRKYLSLIATLTILWSIPEAAWASDILGFNDFAATAMNMLLSLASWFTWLGAIVLNFTITQSVLKMSTWINNEAIYTAWSTFRDLANIVVIFSLLVIGISTILQVQGYGAKQLLARVVLVAIFINFSIFMSKAVIDVGNIVALRFYDAITIDNPAYADGGISTFMLGKMNLQTLYDISLQTTKSDNGVNAVRAATTENEKSRLSTTNIILIGFAGVVLFVITGFVLFGMAIALIHRFVKLTLVIIFSSVAFAAAIFPKTKSLWDMWLKALIENTFYAPVFMMMIWVSFLILEELPNIVDKQANLASLTYGTSSAETGAAAIFNILIVCALMVASLMGAKQMGLAGSTTAMNGMNGVRNYATRKLAAGAFGGAGALGRYYIGRKANEAAEKMSKTPFSRTRMGKFALETTRKIADSSFDARNPINKGLGAMGVKGVDVGKGVKGGFVTHNENFATDAKKYTDSLEADPAVGEKLTNALKEAVDIASEYAKRVHDGAQRDLRELEGEYEKLKTRKAATEAAYQRAKDRKDTKEMRKLDIDLRKITDDFTKVDVLLDKRKKDFKPVAETYADLQNNVKLSEAELTKHKNSPKAEYIKELEKTIKQHGVLAQWSNETLAEIIHGKTRRLEAIAAINKVKDPIKELSEQIAKIPKATPSTP